MIVTADDLGLSPAVTRGALRAAREGVVRSVSVIVNLPEGKAALAEARSVDGVEVGVHLNILVGPPVSDPAAVPSLVDHEGQFVGLRTFVFRLLRGAVRGTELAEELRAQVRRARDEGTPALAWDSHRHVHLLPPVARVVAAVARELGARYVRRASPPPRAAARRGATPLALGALTLACAPAYRGLGANDWYLDLTTANLSAADVARLADLAGVGELGAHPGEVDDVLRARDGLTDARERDLAVLCDPLVRAELAGKVRPRVLG